MTVASILQNKGHDVVSVDRSHKVADVVELLCKHRIGAVLVIEGGAVEGIVSERDIIRGLQDKGSAILDCAVADIMTADLVTVGPDEGLIEALSLITERRIRHLPVVEGGKLCGLVSIGDLVKKRIEIIEYEAASLKDYIQHA